MGRILMCLLGVALLACPASARPGDGMAGDAKPHWGGFIGALQRHVGQALERAGPGHLRPTITKPGMARPGGAGASAAGEVAGSDGRSGEDPEDQATSPARLRFASVSPNPSEGRVTFRFDLPAAATVRIAILDIAGRVVHELGGPYAAGRHALTWSGRDHLGPMGRSGIYFARLEVDSHPIGSRRLVVLR